MRDKKSEQMVHDSRDSLVKQVRLWGDLNTDAVLDSGCQIFSIPSIEGFIAYRVEENCAVVFGDPLCALSDQIVLAKAFQGYCKEQGFEITYLILSEKFAQEAMNECGQILIKFGDKIILDPDQDPLKRTGPKAVLVRKKVKRALKEGVVVHEYLSRDPLIENAIIKIGDSWLGSRHGSQIHIANLNLFEDREGKRWFYAVREEKVIGFLLLNQIQAHGGWLLNNLILAQDASNGTSELLVISTLDTLRNETCRYVAIGPVTQTENLEIVGASKMASSMARMVFKAAKYFFRLDQQRVFWDKFQPHYEPSYLLFNKISIRTLTALFRSMHVNLPSLSSLVSVLRAKSVARNDSSH